REIGEDEMATLRDLALMVESELQAIALTEAHSELLEDLREAERAALIDPMTRTWNRRGGEQLLQREWESMQRKSAPLAIAILDIDHFKKVNDTYGHDAGDEVIRQVSKTLLKNLRPSDLLCRWGGEEFLLLFPECGEADVNFALSRLIKAVGESVAETAAGALTVTASIGAVVTVPIAAHCADDFVKYADTALYEAKENGRNRFEMYDFDQSDGKVVGF
ncbi:MAG: GGDEF domain-containing protein, partial [Pseudomonadales bacterium]